MTVHMTTIPVAAQQQSPAGRAPELCHGAARKDHGCSVWRRTGASALLGLPVHHAAAEPTNQADLHVVKTSAEAVIPLHGGDLGNLRRERRHRMHLHAAVVLHRLGAVVLLLLHRHHLRLLRNRTRNSSKLRLHGLQARLHRLLLSPDGSALH